MPVEKLLWKEFHTKLNTVSCCSPNAGQKHYIKLVNKSSTEYQGRNKLDWSVSTV